MAETAEVVPFVQAEANSLMDVIQRAAVDPKTDVDKLERLLAMYERIKAREAKSAYTEALTAAQQEIPVIAERGGIKNNAGAVQSTYALWEDINDVIKPILARHGFALSFRTGNTDGKILVTGILSHKDGHSEETTITLPADTSGSKNAVQAVGSSTSYGKRYTAQALLNMTSRGEDDDGRKAAKGLPRTDEAPNPKTAATEWAKKAEENLATFTGSGELSLWHRQFADKIASIRPLNEAAHKRLIDAIHLRTNQLSSLNR